MSRRGSLCSDGVLESQLPVLHGSEPLSVAGSGVCEHNSLLTDITLLLHLYLSSALHLIPETQSCTPQDGERSGSSWRKARVEDGAGSRANAVLFNQQDFEQLRSECRLARCFVTPPSRQTGTLWDTTSCGATHPKPVALSGNGRG